MALSEGVCRLLAIFVADEMVDSREEEIVRHYLREEEEEAAEPAYHQPQPAKRLKRTKSCILTTIAALQSDKIRETPIKLRETIRKESVTRSLTIHYSDVEFHEQFRMTKLTFNLLLDVLNATECFEKTYRGGNMPLTVEKCLLIGLYYLTHKDSMSAVGERFNVARSSVHYCVRTLSKALQQVSSKYMTWPSPEECMEVMTKFESIAGFPGIIGCIDEVLIPILASNKQQVPFTERKNRHSVIVQGICTSERLFTNCFIANGDSEYGGPVFQNSEIFCEIKDNYRNYFPTKDCHLLGSYGYTLEKWLMSPFNDDGTLTVQQTKFNDALLKTHFCIEHVFGLVKGRFQKLQCLNGNTKSAPPIVLACCVLHNFCIINCDGCNDDIVPYDDPTPRTYILGNEENNRGILKRNIIASLL